MKRNILREERVGLNVNTKNSFTTDIDTSVFYDIYNIPVQVHKSRH